MRNLVVSDIHGAYKALDQVLNRCGFNPKDDNLIVLGDTCDGWPEVKECFDFLLTLKNLIYIRGNHDQYFLDYLNKKMDIYDRILWMEQRGDATLESFSNYSTDEIKSFLENTKLYHVIGDNLFCHGGVPLNITPDALKNVDPDYFLWDRNIVSEAIYHMVSNDPVVQNFNEVFIGHTPTICYNIAVPKKYSNVWLCDTGASYYGMLSVIDATTKEFWQSDTVQKLYPNHKGR